MTRLNIHKDVMYCNIKFKKYEKIKNIQIAIAITILVEHYDISPSLRQTT